MDHSHRLVENSLALNGSTRHCDGAGISLGSLGEERQCQQGGVSAEREAWGPGVLLVVSWRFLSN